MTNTISIDGYRAVIQYDPEIEMFRGEFVDLNGGADFYAQDVEGLKREAKESLDVFLDMCREDGVQPRVPSKSRDAAPLQAPTKNKVSRPPKQNDQFEKDQISSQAVDWAISHLQKHGDTDIFPTPFEYLTIDDDAIRKHVEDLDLASCDTKDARLFLVPKSTLDFRVSHQLDPIDSIVYTAAVYEISDRVESGRLSVDSRVACSYRIHPTSAGDFFPADNGWRSYHTQSLGLAGEHKFVLHVDIAEFYNQIYHHRVQGALQSMGISARRSKNIERFLGTVTARQSQGIPIGPAASHVLAESLLNDIDRSLVDKHRFTRYADDYRIFVNSRREATDVLQHLYHYLYTGHRLTIGSAKTRLQPSNDFLNWLEDPERKEQDEKEQILDEQIAMWFGYAINESGGSEEEHSKEEMEEALTRLFHEAVNHDPIRAGMVQYVLRRATSIRSCILYPLVLDNLETLIPVFRDVCLYLLATLPDSFDVVRNVGDRLRMVAQESHLSCPYVRMWVLHLLQERPAMAEYAAAMELADSARSELGIRPHALLARAFNNIQWVRQKKEEIMNLSPWDKRAVIYAADILPEDEKKHWLRLIRKKGEFLDKAIANYLLRRCE